MTRIILLVLLSAFSVHAYAGTLTNLPGGPSWLHGTGQISVSDSPTGYDKWKSWMGHEPDIMTVWTASVADWAEFENGNTGYYFKTTMAVIPTSTPIVLAYPMVPKSISNRNCANPGMWDQFAAGNFDAHYRKWATNFKAIVRSYGRDPANHVIRLGWEMNGDWYPWSVCNKVAEFKASWERAVNILRTEIPGIMIDFSPARNYVGFNAGWNYSGGYCGSGGCNLEALLPEESSYDVISRSVHDVRPFTIDETSWQKSNYDPHSFGLKQFGLIDIVASAKLHGKKIALTEWGTQMADCGADHPTSPNPALFLQKVYEFLNANASLVAWDTHFSVGCAQLYGRQSTDAAQKYKALWGSGTGGGSVTIDAGTGDGTDPAAPNPPELLFID